MCGTARLLGQTGDRRPVHACVADGVEIQRLFGDSEVRSHGSTVEVEREVVGREDLAEGDRGLQFVIDPYELVVDTEAGELAADEPAERVVARAGDDGRTTPVSCCGDRDVRRAAAEVLAERLDVFEPDPALVWIEVDADATDGDHIVRGWSFVGHASLHNSLFGGHVLSITM